MVGIVCWEEILKAVHMTWSLSTLRFDRAVVMTVINDLVKRRAKGLLSAKSHRGAKLYTLRHELV